MSDPRDTFISAVVNGKSFVDVGGLWGTVNEKVSVAFRAGAVELGMIDITPPEREEWSLFRQRCRSLEISEIRCLSADILSLTAAPGHPRYDVVHCSGVLYHLPDVMRFMKALRALTREHLILTSAVTSTRVASDLGTLEIPESCFLFVPALRDQELAILRAYWTGVVGDGAVGITRDVERWDHGDYGPWWWLPTVEALKALCAAAGFSLVGGSASWNGNAYTLLLRS